MFNESQKNEFLSQYPAPTQTTYRRIFIKGEVAENLLGKDLCEFSRGEIEEILYDLNPLTAPVSRSNGRIISSYIAWCIERKYKITNLNPLQAVDTLWFDKFVDKNKKLYYSANEIKDIEMLCENAQDAVIIRLFFEGVNGKDASEIRNLMIDDVDQQNCLLVLREDGNSAPRIKEVSEECINLIRQAASESTYTKKNGAMDDSAENVRRYTDLVESNYIIRNSITKTEAFNEAVHSSVIYRRLSMISKVLGLSYFGGKNIYRSGVIYYAWKIMKNLKDGEVFGKEHYEKVAAHFGMSSWYPLREYVNQETIESLYGEMAATRSA